MFNKHTYRDSRALKIYGIQLFLPRTKIKDARSCRVTSSFEAERNKEKFPTEQGLGAQCSGEDGRDLNVSHDKYVY